MSFQELQQSADSDDEFEAYEKYALSKDDLTKGKMVRCQILKVVGDRFFSSPSNTIWIAFEDTEINGLYSGYCPLNGKVFVRNFENNCIAKKVLHSLRSIKHKNVLRYIDFGVLLTLDSIIGLQFCMITEWCSALTLYNCIHKHKMQFGLFTILNICQQIIQAIIYLHLNGITQCNITSFKIFLREDNTVKIGNYRIANTEKVPWTFWSAPEERYHAPEIYRITRPQQLINADIYAFGIIFYELLTQTLPYNCVYNNFFLMNRIEKNLIRPELPSRVNGSPQNLVKILAWNQLKACVRFDYQRRPTLEEVLVILNNMIKVTPNYVIKIKMDYK